MSIADSSRVVVVYIVGIGWGCSRRYAYMKLPIAHETPYTSPYTLYPRALFSGGSRSAIDALIIVSKHPILRTFLDNLKCDYCCE